MTHWLNNTLLGITAVSWKFKWIQSTLPTVKIYSQSKLCYCDTAVTRVLETDKKENLNTAFPHFINKPTEVCRKM